MKGTVISEFFLIHPVYLSVRGEGVRCTCTLSHIGSTKYVCGETIITGMTINLVLLRLVATVSTFPAGQFSKVIQVTGRTGVWKKNNRLFVCGLPH